ALGDVRFWITINEPTVYLKRGFLVGDWPPGRARSPLAGMRALYRMCRAHVAAYEVLHRSLPDARVGLAHSAPLITACRPERAADRAAARRRDLLWNDLVFRLISRRPWRRSRPRLDFVGLNYYTRSVVHRGRAGRAALFGEECHAHIERGPFSDLGWEVYPRGLLETLERFSALGLPLMVTENGIATRDEALRSAYLSAHLDVLGQAIAHGVDVIGYLHWTLMDNYEWSHGTEPRFGLLEVDFETQVRTPRPAFHEFGRAIRCARAASPTGTDSAA
ncbi:MAG: family 1 glycosylhydrolase, partial [Gemmatimonadota bacterium]